MAAIHDLIEDWIQFRSVLQRQLKLLETDQTRKGAPAVDVASEATKARLRRCLDEMNALLKQHARSDLS